MHIIQNRPKNRTKYCDSTSKVGSAIRCIVCTFVMGFIEATFHCMFDFFLSKSFFVFKSSLNMRWFCITSHTHHIIFAPSIPVHFRIKKKLNRISKSKFRVNFCISLCVNMVVEAHQIKITCDSDHLVSMEINIAHSTEKKSNSR